jgi:hypothetical protein
MNRRAYRATTFALAALLAVASSAGANGFDQYGGATSLQCGPNPAPITTSISKVARSGQTVTLTVADTGRLARHNAIIVSGTTADRGSFNTAPGSLVYITAKTADAIQYAQPGASVSATPDTGQVQLARFYVSKLGDRWWACTPLGNVFWISGVFSLVTDGGTDYQGINNDSFVKAKYATGPAKSPTLNWLLSGLRRIKDWRFTVLAEGAHVAAQATTTNPSWGTPDQAPPIKMPYIVAPWPSHYAQFQVKGTSTQPAKGYTNGVKRSLPNFNQHINLFRQVDPFDPSFIGWLAGWMKESRPATLAASVNNDYILAIAVDDGDSVAITRATPQFPTYSGGKPMTHPGTGGIHMGFMTLVAAPIKTADTRTTNAEIGSSPANAVIYPDATFNAKRDLAAWLQGSTDTTSSVAASRKGATVTLEVGARHAYGVGDMLTLRSCSEASFNTAPGEPVAVTATTPTSVTYSQSGSGTAASGCTVNTGPGYSIAALNRAWGSAYTSFGSAGANHSVTLCASDCTATRYAGSLRPANVTPLTLSVTVGGTIVAGTDGAGPVAPSPTPVENVVGQGIDKSTVNDSTGAYEITFKAAPNAAVVSSYQTGGWGAGSGVLDEDGTCPAAGGRACWLPRDPFDLCASKTTTALCTNRSAVTPAFQADMDSYLYRLAKTYFRSIRQEVSGFVPGLLYMGTMQINGAPTRCPVLQAAGQYTDILTHVPATRFPDDQQRLDYWAQCVGDRPGVFWFGIRAEPDSYFAGQRAGGHAFPILNTQAERGRRYEEIVRGCLDLVDATYKSHHCIGFKWWQYFDQRGEASNWGLVTPRDNPYDGTSAVIKPGVDKYGYPTGGERADYGDFISHVIRANALWLNYAEPKR